MLHMMLATILYIYIYIIFRKRVTFFITIVVKSNNLVYIYVNIYYY